MIIRFVLAITFIVIISAYSQTPDTSTIDLINPTYLGGPSRNYYGDSLPDSLNIIWKTYLGEGKTVISRRLGERKWKGAGWTGQPLLVKEKDTLFIIQGAYDHNLKKIYAQTGKIKWQYKFDDVIKGTGTIWVNPDSISDEQKYIILQGSRLGVGNYLDSKHIPSYRGISYISGKELWRLDVKWTESYSRDVDGSALVLDTLVYIGLENSLFTIIDPNPLHGDTINKMYQPKILKEHKLYTKKDVVSHKKNIVTESSPSLIDNNIYVTSGSGHVFGYNIIKDTLDWNFFIGSDIDGSAIVTNDSCLLVTIEKQYIKGKGGTLKLNPQKPANDALEWFFPVSDTLYNGWLGGIIGSTAINDNYIDDAAGIPPLAAFTGIDGFLYVVRHDSILKDSIILSFDSTTFVHPPLLIFKKEIGPSISTPIIVGNKLLACGYHGMFLFEFDKNLNFKLIDSKPFIVESTPVCHRGRIYIASRNGYLYCLGNPD